MIRLRKEVLAGIKGWVLEPARLGEMESSSFLWICLCLTNSKISASHLPVTRITTKARALRDLYSICIGGKQHASPENDNGGGISCVARQPALPGRPDDSCSRRFRRRAGQPAPWKRSADVHRFRPGRSNHRWP